MPKTDQERKQEAENWNNWKPGSGRKGWSPFNKPIPPAKVVTSTGHPPEAATTGYWKKVCDEINERQD